MFAEIRWNGSTQSDIERGVEEEPARDPAHRRLPDTKHVDVGDRQANASSNEYVGDTRFQHGPTSVRHVRLRGVHETVAQERGGRQHQELPEQNCQGDCRGKGPHYLCGTGK